jgi:hypothetical protein
VPPQPALLRPSRTRGDVIDVCVAGRAVVSLKPDSGRVRVGLVMHPLNRVVDVSIQPSAACETLQDAARRTASPAATIETAAREALLEARNRCASWAPPEDASLLAGFGGAAFPLLGAAYDAGTAPVTEVPRWAEPVVAARSAREGAIAAFGDRTTRPVVRALVAALQPASSTDIDFSNLALAIAGRDVLQPDCLARVLSAERVAHPAHDLPDPNTLNEVRQTVTMWGATRAERVLLDAAASADGLKLLLAAVRFARQLRGHSPPFLPNRLTELHDAYRCRVQSAPQARPRPVPPPVRSRRTTAQPEQPQPRHRIFAPPTNLMPVGAGTQLQVTPAVQALHGRRFGDLTFVIPRTAGDLQRWGRLLSNCLGDFAPAMATGQSTIIGIERSNSLAYAVEIDPNGTIRQLAGHANRPPDDSSRLSIIRTLSTAGVLRPDRI